MLLKIYTDKNSLVIIENIEDIEVHNGTYVANSVEEITDLNRKPHLGPQTSRPIAVINYYDSGEAPQLDNFAPGTIPVKFIDFSCAGTNGLWRRLAIGFYGVCYICNDQGKTIERVLEPGRAVS